MKLSAKEVNKLPIIMTSNDISSFLELTPDDLPNLIKRGLRVYKEGRQWRVKRGRFLEWIRPFADIEEIKSLVKPGKGNHLSKGRSVEKLPTSSYQPKNTQAVAGVSFFSPPFGDFFR